jgi:hypothetical protein
VKVGSNCFPDWSLFCHAEFPVTASEKCHQEKRKTVNGEDILFAMTSLGFENYAEALKIYLAKYREVSILCHTPSDALDLIMIKLSIYCALTTPTKFDLVDAIHKRREPTEPTRQSRLRIGCSQRLRDCSKCLFNSKLLW